VVLAVYVGCFAFLAWFVASHAARVPYHDDYANLHLILNQNTFKDYWQAHNDHRIPLPRLVYVGAVIATGLDFRAPLALNVLFLSGAAALVLLALRRYRGRFAVTDAFVPLTVMSVANWENLTWGFQLQFTISTALVLGLIVLALRGGVAGPGRLVVVGVVAALLPFCGSNGVVFAPPIGAALLVIGVCRLREGRRWAAAVAVMGAGLALAITTAYFGGLKSEVPRPPASPAAMLVGLVDLPGVGFGPASYLAHGEAYSGLTAVGVLTTAFLAVTGLMLLRNTWAQDRRDTAILLGAVLVGVFGLAAGISYGRAGYDRGVFAPRYTTLFVPGLVAGYAAWTAFGTGRAARRVCGVLLVTAIAVSVPNARFAIPIADMQRFYTRDLEHQMKEGQPVGVVADQNPYLFGHEAYARRIWLELLRRTGVAPFSLMRPDPAYHVEPVPVRVVRSDGMTATDAGYTVEGDRGGIVLALPRRGFVHVVRLTYVSERPLVGPLVSTLVSWGTGQFPPAGGCSRLNPLDRTTGGTTTTTFWVGAETDLIRIDIMGAGSRLRVEAVELLTEPN
jgi:hypothetical protein